MPNDGVKWYRELDDIFIKTFGATSWAFEDYDWDAEFKENIPPQEAFDEWRLIAGDKQ